MKTLDTESIKQKFTHEELHKALLNVEDMMLRLLITDWFVAKQTAFNIKNDKMLDFGDNDGIDVLIRDKSFSQYVNNIISTFGFNPEEAKHGFEYKVDKVPVRVKVYSRDYQVFKYPDMKVYEYGAYKLPNPFATYWQMKGIIK